MGMGIWGGVGGAGRVRGSPSLSFRLPPIVRGRFVWNGELCGVLVGTRSCCAARRFPLVLTGVGSCSEACRSVPRSEERRVGKECRL